MTHNIFYLYTICERGNRSLPLPTLTLALPCSAAELTLPLRVARQCLLILGLWRLLLIICSQISIKPLAPLAKDQVWDEFDGIHPSSLLLRCLWVSWIA